MNSYQEKLVKTGSMINYYLPFIFALILYFFLYSRYFINDNGIIGGDYSYFFPQLLSGYFWYLENGIFVIPWFTPGFCGGLPSLPNPQSIYYSVPQFLLIWLEPLLSVYITFIIFASIGMIAFYLLLARVFKFSRATALLGSIIFLFNGFYLSRMIMGHLTYHVFMLVPVIAYLLMYPSAREDRNSSNLISIILSGFCFSYIVHAGALNFVVPILIMLIGINLCFRLISGKQNFFWYRFFLSGFLSLCISSSKLVSTYLFIQQFPRNLYSLPGFEGITNGVFNVFKSLAGLYQGEIAGKLTNLSFPVSAQGFDFSIGVAPLIIIILYVLFRLVKLLGTREPKNTLFPPYNSAIWPLAFILFIPVLLNTYYPVWNDILKTIPYIKNSSLLTRWIAIDIPLLIVIVCCIVDKLKHNRSYYYVICMVAGIVLVENLMKLEQHKEGMSYNASRINSAYIQARENGQAVTIEMIGAYINKKNEFVKSHSRNDELTAGISILNCYEPIFGYFGEQFPAKQLRPGPVIMHIENRLNLKNPSCYVFPEENNCQPGDHYLIQQQADAEKFISYKPINIHMPVMQIISNWISLLSIVFSAMLLLLLSQKNYLLK